MRQGIFFADGPRHAVSIGGLPESAQVLGHLLVQVCRATRCGRQLEGKLLYSDPGAGQVLDSDYIAHLV